jgi:hypothetical protein
MTWVTWRQQRTEGLIAAAVLALLVALLVPTGLHMASVYDHDGLASCVHANSPDCQQVIGGFINQFEHGVGGLLPWLNLVPGIIGVLLAAPFVLELESGTYRLAWTQSITRRRWIASKLGITVLAAVVSALAMTALLTWWRSPLDHVQGRMTQSVFDFEGTVGIGYVLFALGLALAIGVVWRRTVPAVILAFGGYVVLRVFVQNWLRERYEAPLTATWSMTRGFVGPNMSKDWILREEPSDKYGHPVSMSFGVLRSCGSAVKGTVKLIDPSCLARAGSGYNHAVYQPASRFWAFQGIETALFGGLGVALILFAAWWVHERAS